MDWYTAPVRPGSLIAVDDGSRLVITGVATAPTPGYSARIITLPMNTYPPEFAIEIKPQDGSFSDVITEVPCKGQFDRAPGMRSIVVYAAEGSYLVPIHLTSAAAGGPADITRATGYSASFNFDEAFGSAVAQITIRTDFSHVKVVEIGATTGIFPFQHRMYVTVERG